MPWPAPLIAGIGQGRHDWPPGPRAREQLIAVAGRRRAVAGDILRSVPMPGSCVLPGSVRMFLPSPYDRITSRGNLIRPGCHGCKITVVLGRIRREGSRGPAERRKPPREAPACDPMTASRGSGPVAVAGGGAQCLWS